MPPPISIDLRRDLPKVREEGCPGHVASDGNPKVCGRCGVHIDSLRPEPEGGQ
jgi:hypothetical protein